MQRYKRYVLGRYGCHPFAQTPIQADSSTGKFIYDGHAFSQAAGLRIETIELLDKIATDRSKRLIGSPEGISVDHAKVLVAISRTVANCAKQLGYHLP